MSKFPLWDKKTEDLVLDTAIDPLPELREMAKFYAEPDDDEAKDS